MDLVWDFLTQIATTFIVPLVALRFLFDECRSLLFTK